MTLKISPQFMNKFEAKTRKVVKDMANPDALAPIILLETAVTTGRTFQAYKRGGKNEARERGIEETLGAIFWLGGVAAFQKMGDKIGQKLMKLKDVNFDGKRDAVRDPLGKFLQKIHQNGQHAKINKNVLTAFKFTKVVASVLLANAFVGFVVPKMNHAITNHFLKKQKTTEQNAQIKPSDAKTEQIQTTANAQTEKTAQTPQTQPVQKPLAPRMSMNDFAQKASKKNNKDVAFTGFADGLLTATNLLENDAKCKLLSTDVGIAGGRAYNARNNDERFEILFRDLSSVYFYMFCRPHLNKALNYIEDGKTNRLDPTSAKIANDEMLKSVQNGKSVNSENFLKEMFGEKDVKLPEGLKFKDETIMLKDFEAVEKNADKLDLARRMAKLQPETVKGAILTKEQVEDVYRGGKLNQPEFLKNLYSQATNGASDSEYKFISQKKLKQIKSGVRDYVEDICKKSTEITEKTLKKANVSNLLKNGFNLGIGFVVAGIFLSTVIPKVQYWLTKIRTGNDGFPGMEGVEGAQPVKQAKEINKAKQA